MGLEENNNGTDNFINNIDYNKIFEFSYSTAISYINTINCNKFYKNELEKENFAIEIVASLFREDISGDFQIRADNKFMDYSDNAIDLEFYIFKAICGKIDDKLEIH